MPCDASYMNPNRMEENMSQVLCCLDEIDKGIKIDPEVFEGYHDDAYCKRPTQEQLDAKTAELCGKIRNLDVTKYSLELQLWWRDHQEADGRRDGFLKVDI